MYKKYTWLLVWLFSLAGCLSVGIDKEVSTQTQKTEVAAQRQNKEPTIEREPDTAITVTIINDIGFDIYNLSIRPAGTDLVEAMDFLYGDILFNGESADIRFPYAGLWDILLEDEDRDLYILYNQDIKEDSYCTITLNMLDY